MDRDLLGVLAVLAPGDELPDLLDALVGRPDWHAQAACRGHPQLFFPGAGDSTATTREALQMCDTCPVRRPCLDFALADPHLVGIWAGTNPAERRRLRKERRGG